MRALLIVTDSEAVPVFERTLAALRQARDAEGYGSRTRMWSFDVAAAD